MRDMVKRYKIYTFMGVVRNSVGLPEVMGYQEIEGTAGLAHQKADGVAGSKHEKAGRLTGLVWW